MPCYEVGQVPAIEQWHEWRIAGRGRRRLGRRTPRFDRFLEAGDHFRMSVGHFFGFVCIPCRVTILLLLAPNGNRLK